VADNTMVFRVGGFALVNESFCSVGGGVPAGLAPVTHGLGRADTPAPTPAASDYGSQEVAPRSF
jgi:hypothetical protein